MNDQVALTITPSAMPTLSMAQAKSRRDDMLTFVRSIMVSGSDYGVVPGTGTKPTLLKPGAEKLATFFGLRPTFSEVHVIEDWTGKDHGGAPFFYYWFRCHLLKGDEIIAEGDGSCNSLESKYRYRQGERQCPKCGKAAIIKGKAEYGGGWLCFAKKGGCGAKFAEGDKAIEGQQTGRVENPDIADQVNTLLKMAQKRALVAAVLIGVNASEFFTQDIEDMAGSYIEGEYQVSEPPANGQPEPPRTAAPAPRQRTATEAQPEPKAEAPKLAKNRTPQFGAYATTLADKWPAYRNEHGSFDDNHIRASIATNLNVYEITDANIDALFAKLHQRAIDQASIEQAPA